MKTSLRFRSYSKRAKWIGYPIATVAALNFFAFVAISSYLGGDALNGYTKVGRYFLCAHGACVEVSKAVWNYSYWHALSAFGGIALVFVVAAVFLNTGDIQFD